MRLPPYEVMYRMAVEHSDHHEAVDEFLPCLLAGLRATPPEADALEIGYWHGGSALFTAWHLGTEGLGRRLVTVDNGQYAGTGLKRAVKDWGFSPWTHFVSDQHDWVKALEPDQEWKFGFVYHDGEHGDASVRLDIDGLAPYIVQGGTLAVDDAHMCTGNALDFRSLGLERQGWEPPHRGCHDIKFYQKVA